MMNAGCIEKREGQERAFIVGMLDVDAPCDGGLPVRFLRV